MTRIYEELFIVRPDATDERDLGLLMAGIEAAA